MNIVDSFKRMDFVLFEPGEILKQENVTCTIWIYKNNSLELFQKQRTRYIYLFNENKKAVPAQLKSSLDSVNFSNGIDEHTLQNQIVIIFK